MATFLYEEGSNHLAMRTQIFSLFFALGVLLSGTLFANETFNNQKEIDNEKISVYPNPVSDKGVLQIELDESSNAKIEFFDLSGKKVKEIKKINLDEGTNKIEFKTTELNEGFYFCKVSTSLWVKATRIVVRR